MSDKEPRKRWVPRPEMTVAEYLRAQANGDIKSNIAGHDLMWMDVTEQEYLDKWHEYHKQHMSSPYVSKGTQGYPWQNVPVTAPPADKP